MPYNLVLAERIRSQVGGIPGMPEKKMFGGVGFILNGNMACGVHRDYLVIRLDITNFNEAVKLPHVKAMDITGKPMKGWIMVSQEGYDSEPELKTWIDRGVQFASTLPPK